jgi:hypothetical protein
VLIIHGDGDYSYHDALGQARKADEEVLAKAQAVGEGNPNAEVIIFHQIARRHALLLFPRHDGRAYYYRHGRLLAETSYWRDQGKARFDPEVRLYEQFTALQSRPPVRILFYFGHELPEIAAAGYDASCETVLSSSTTAEGGERSPGSSGDRPVCSPRFGERPPISALAPTRVRHRLTDNCICPTSTRAAKTARCRTE